MPNQDNWKLYYERTLEKPPRETLIKALDFFAKEELKGEAFDIGSGACNDVLHLFKQGWKVTAVDNEIKAQQYFQNRCGHLTGLQFQLASFEEIDWHPVELIHAGFALAFCPREHFLDVMKHIDDNIKINGRFAGNFFGLEHTWDDLQLVSASEVKALFKNYDIEYFNESITDRKSTLNENIHHHNISIVAKKVK